MNLDSDIHKLLDDIKVYEYVKKHDFLSYAAEEWITHFQETLYSFLSPFFIEGKSEVSDLDISFGQ